MSLVCELECNETSHSPTTSDANHCLTVLMDTTTSDNPSSVCDPPHTQLYVDIRVEQWVSTLYAHVRSMWDSKGVLASSVVTRVAVYATYCV